MCVHERERERSRALVRLYVWNRVCEIVLMGVWEQVCKRVWECPFECEWRERLLQNVARDQSTGFGGKHLVPANFPSLLDSKRKTLGQKEYTQSCWREPLASNPVLWYSLRGVSRSSITRRWVPGDTECVWHHGGRVSPVILCGALILEAGTLRCKSYVSSCRARGIEFLWWQLPLSRRKYYIGHFQKCF